jgi:hypothetical protein
MGYSSGPEAGLRIYGKTPQNGFKKWVKYNRSRKYEVLK